MPGCVRCVERKTPLSYSQGFHPHPKMAFSSAMPVNTQSLGEYLDITLVQRVDPDAYLAKLREGLPEGFGAHAVAEVPRSAPSLMSLNVGSDYEIDLPLDRVEAVRERIEALLAQDRIEAKRKTKQKRRRKQPADRVVDLRPSVQSCSVHTREGEGGCRVHLRVLKIDGILAKVRELLPMLSECPERAVVVRLDTLLVDGDGTVRPMAEGWAPTATGPSEPAKAWPRGAKHPVPNRDGRLARETSRGASHV